MVPHVLERPTPFRTLKGRGERARLPEPGIGQHRLQLQARGSEVNDVVHVAAVAVVDAQDVGKLRHADPGIGGLSAKRVGGRNPHALQLRYASWISPSLGGSRIQWPRTATVTLPWLGTPPTVNTTG